VVTWSDDDACRRRRQWEIDEGGRTHLGFPPLLSRYLARSTSSRWHLLVIPPPPRVGRVVLVMMRAPPRSLTVVVVVGGGGGGGRGRERKG
jgi:hypothetical protein